MWWALLLGKQTDTRQKGSLIKKKMQTLELKSEKIKYKELTIKVVKIQGLKYYFS